MVLDKITRYTNGFLFNAGIVGFINVLDEGEFSQGANYSIDGNGLVFTKNSFEKFTDKYFVAMKNRFREGSSYEKLVSDIETFLRSWDNYPENKKNLDNIIKKMTAASYLSGYEIIMTNGNSYDINKAITLLKSEKDNEQRRNLLEKVLMYVKENEDVLLMKDIAYTKINSFWSSISFMNTQESKKNMRKLYDDYFTEATIAYFDEKKNAKQKCVECGDALGKNKFAMSWLNDFGVDLVRKKSHYWNYKVDTHLCPICNLIYSCAPLGFNMVGKEGIFINENSSVSRLKSCNVPAAHGNLPNVQMEIYGRILQAFKKSGDEKLVENEIGNVQVIRRSNFNSDTQKYQFNVFSKNQFKALSNCERELSRIVKANPRLGEKFVGNVYNKVMDLLMSNKILYPYIYEMLSLSWSENLVAWFLKDVLMIQIKYFKKEGEDAMNNVIPLEKKIFFMTKKSEELKKAVVVAEGNSEDNANNKLRGFVYQLLNALKTKDINRFMDIVCRLYIGLGKEIPMDFKDMLSNEELFLALGYAFVIGLKGEHTASNKNGSNTETSEEIMNFEQEEK